MGPSVKFVVVGVDSVKQPPKAEAAEGYRQPIGPQPDLTLAPAVTVSRAKAKAIASAARAACLPAVVEEPPRSMVGSE